MGDLGYISHAQDSLNISFNSLDAYCLDLKNALHTPFEQYKKIGEFKDAERIQLNDSIIQIENEYYSTIRPKRVCPSGERPINVLKDEGIDYLELRCIDLNPSSPIGINKEQIYFRLINSILFLQKVLRLLIKSLKSSSKLIKRWSTKAEILTQRLKRKMGKFILKIKQSILLKV